MGKSDKLFILNTSDLDPVLVVELPDAFMKVV